MGVRLGIVVRTYAEVCGVYRVVETVPAANCGLTTLCVLERGRRVTLRRDTRRTDYGSRPAVQ